MLARKPGALRNGAPFEDPVLPTAMERERRQLADGAIAARLHERGIPTARGAGKWSVVQVRRVPERI